MAQSILVSELHDFEKYPEPENAGDCYVDGIKVSPHVANFCDALRRDRAFRNCKFGVAAGQNYGSKGAVFVYFPDEMYCRGTVGHGDIGVRATIYKYFVEGEFVSNRKVRSNSRLFNVLGSNDIHKAIKLAKTHLREYSIAKIVSLSAYKLSSAMSEEKDSKTEAESSAMNNLRDMLTRSGALTAELTNMVYAGYEFKDDRVKQGIVDYMDTIDGDIEVSSRNISIAIVLVHPPHADNPDHMITVKRGTRHLNLRKRVYSGDIQRALEDAVVEKYTQHTLPDDIRGRISTLNVLEGNSYVDGVGCRQSENIYYIAEDV